MKSASVALLLLLAAVCTGFADSAISKVQESLKEQGFYYGDVNGQLDADTTAAIRRYQIRNGLKVSGELDAETRKALGVPASATTGAKPQPSRTPQPTRSPETDARDHNVAEDSVGTPPPRARERGAPDLGYAPGPHGLQAEISGVFDGTPYEVAPPDLQRRVMIGAQTLLARRGYYRSGIDGAFGPATELALRNFQINEGLRPTGRLNIETLSALGLLPGEERPRFRRPRWRRMVRPSEISPDGEPIYTPND